MLMEIEFEGGSALAFLAIILIMALLLFGLVGKLVTPVHAQEARLLTPDRWTAYKLQRLARKETVHIVADARELRKILGSDEPDPVAAMLLAQRIYADHLNGSSATAAARGALIAAAEAAVRATVGEIPRTEAVSAFNSALQRIEALGTTAEPVAPMGAPTLAPTAAPTHIPTLPPALTPTP